MDLHQASAGHELATRQDIEAILAALDAMDERWDERWSERQEAMDKRWQVDGGELREALLGVFERRLDDAVTPQTGSLTITLMVSMVAIAGLAFGMN